MFVSGLNGGFSNGSDGIRIVTTNGLGVFARLFDRAYYVTGHVPPLLARSGLNGSELIKWLERDRPTSCTLCQGLQ